MFLLRQTTFLLCLRKALAVFLVGAFSFPVVGLESLDDEALGEFTGQAVVSLATDTIGSIKYTRVNLGVDVATQLNADKVSLGTRERDGIAGF